MPNEIFNRILDRKIDTFTSVFLEDSENIFKIDGKLFHPQEFGIYRERVVSEIIKSVVPENLDVKDGFVITSKNRISTQSDIILFDKNKTPVINDGVLNFFPIESVCAIGEVKSVINSKQELKEILIKLSKQKELDRDTTRKKDDNGIERGELISTFLVCKKFNFEFSNDFSDIYDGIANDLRHNIILSLEDGIFSYQIERESLRPENREAFDKYLVSSRLSYYPVLMDDLLPDLLSKPGDDDKYLHIKMFLHSISSALENVRKPNLELQLYYLK